MRKPVRAVSLLVGGLILSVSTSAAPPQPSAEDALAAEQSNLRNALYPSCNPRGDEIVVCARRRPDRDRLPLREERGQALRGEPPSTVTAMNAIGLPLMQSVGSPPKGGNKAPFFDVSAMVLSVAVRLINRDHDPPPIPNNSAAN
jgi:hypothetical protein